MLRRLWCTLEVDEQDVLLHLPRELMTPLSLILREQRHQELRSRLLFFDTDTKAALYLSGMLSAKQALSRLYESVLHDSYANDEALALRYLKAGNDFYYNRAGELFLLHPGLADPEKILREGGFPMGYQPDLPSERALMASRDLLPEEFETDAQLSALLDSCMGLETAEESSAHDLRILVKQHVTWSELMEVVRAMLPIPPTKELTACLHRLYAFTPRWGTYRAALVQ